MRKAICCAVVLSVTILWNTAVLAGAISPQAAASAFNNAEDMAFPLWENTFFFQAEVQGETRYGFVSIDDRLAVLPESGDAFFHFSEGLAASTLDGKVGYINKRGEYVIPPAWDAGEVFSDGLAPVEQDGLWGFIDKTGQLVIQPAWEEVMPFAEGLAAVLDNSLWGYIDRDGNIAIAPHWSMAKSFSQGRAVVGDGAFAGYIDTAGLMTSPLQWEAAKSFRDGLALVMKDGHYGYINRNGTEIIAPEWDEVGFGTYDERANTRYDDPDQRPSKWAYEPDGFIGGFVRIGKDGLYGFADKAGGVLGPRWDDPAPFSEGMAAVLMEGKYGYIDANGRIAIAPEWDSAEAFSEGLAVVSRGGLCGFINTQGEIVIPLIWQGAGPYHGGLAAIWHDGKAGFVDAAGRVVIAPKWTYTSGFVVGKGGELAEVSDGELSGFINRHGELIIPMQDMSSAPNFWGDDYIVYHSRADGLWHMVDLEGNPIL